MLCLEIPLDYRLSKIIKDFRSVPQRSHNHSEHLKLLYNFGKLLYYNGNEAEKVPPLELDFALQLARPEITGGILIVLLHPDSSQKFNSGYLTESEKCPTLKAVFEIIEVVSNGYLSEESVSIFDSLPFMVENYDASAVHRKSQETFLEMLKAKKPEVVISCFGGESHLKEVISIRKRGIGQTFTPQSLCLVPEYRTMRVSAIHPSYVVNRVATESCFKRLLVLEFAHGFGVWRNSWNEEEWMRDLRELCREKSRQYSDYDGPTEGEFDSRLRQLIKAVDKILESNGFFGVYSSFRTPEVRSQVADTNLSWLLCDISLILKDAIARGWNIDYGLLDKFDDWCCAVSPMKLNFTKFPNTGYFDHQQLLLQHSLLQGEAAWNLQTLLMTFLRQLNLSYAPHHISGEYLADITIQADAFQYFSRMLETLLARMHNPIHEESVKALVGSIHKMDI